MTKYNYLIIGGGMTGASAIRGIREIDRVGTIAVLSHETHKPYDRPPLSKQLWTGQKTEADIYSSVPEGVDFHLGRWAAHLDPAQKRVTADTGEQFAYEKLLLATGGTPRRLDSDGNNIIYFRTLDDYRRLRRLVIEHDRFAVIGGGFIGSEIAASLAKQGKQVFMLFPEPGIGARLFPADLSAFLNGYYRERGVEVMAGARVRAVSGSGGDLTVMAADNRLLNVHAVIAGIGIRPNILLAASAGLEVTDGIVVNSNLQTSHPSIYAAGDVANYHDVILGLRRRVEHEDAAVDMGKAAGRSMAGGDATYDGTPMFYSDLFELGYEAVGILDARMSTRAEWEEPFKKGTIYYAEGGRIRGILLWNVWGMVDQARTLLCARDEGATVHRNAGDKSGIDAAQSEREQNHV